MSTSRKWSRRASVLAALTTVTAMSGGVSFADDISNNLDPSIDAVAEVMPLNVGGVNGTTTLYVTSRNGDGKSGCNFQGSETLVLDVASSAPAVATVSPATVTFGACGDTRLLTITPVAVGATTISVTQASNNTGGTFNLAPATFDVNVAPPANTAPTVSVGGVTGGASYAEGSVPAATCNVTDAEDGNSSFAASLSAITGPYASDGIGSQTASCSYTDKGGQKAVASETYSITDPTAPSVTPVVTGTLGDNGWYISNVNLSWTVTDGDSTVTKTGCDPVSVTADQSEIEYTCSATSAGGTTTKSVKIKRDATAPTVSPGDNHASDWRSGDLSVAFTASDNGGSGLANPADAAFTLTAAGESATSTTRQTDSRTVYDAAGNSTVRAISALIDRHGPTIVGDDVEDSTWRNTPLKESFAASDALSGLATPADATFDLEATAESASPTSPTVVSKTVTDKVGNATTRTLSAHIDLTAPEVEGDDVVDSTWRNTPLKQSFTSSDALSGLKDADDEEFDLEASAESAGPTSPTVVGRTVKDNAGNATTRTLSARIDLTAPSVTGDSVAETAWRNTSLLRSFTSSDPLSGLKDSDDEEFDLEASLESVSTSIPTSVTRNVYDNAGNVTTRTVSAFIDRTNPVISGSNVANTVWRNNSLSASFTASDALSGLANGSDGSFTLTAADESANIATPTTVTRTVKDNAGNESKRSVSAFIDLTAPSVPQIIGGPASGGSYPYGTVPNAPSGCNASDALSGLSSCSVSGYATTVGSHTLLATATDSAGNTRTTSVTYTVEAWRTGGFYAPVDVNGTLNTVKGGSTVPLKFELFAGTQELTDTASVKSFTSAKINCDGSAPLDEIEVTSTGGTSLRYDATGGQFIQNWKTPTGAGTCYRATMTAQDGSSISALFKIK